MSEINKEKAQAICQASLYANASLRLVLFRLFVGQAVVYHELKKVQTFQRLHR